MKYPNVLLYGGGRPKGDAPLPRKLDVEVKTAATYLSNHRVYEHLKEPYARRRPLCAQLPGVLPYEGKATTHRVFGVTSRGPYESYLTGPSLTAENRAI